MSYKNRIQFLVVLSVVSLVILGLIHPALATDFAVGSSPISLTTGDFNRDDKLDLAVADAYFSRVNVLLGDGNGSFPNQNGASMGGGLDVYPFSITFGDFNRDGKLDLATGDNLQSNNVSVVLGHGDGSYSNPVFYSAGGAPSSIITGDFNRDGKLDLAIANSASNNLSVLLGKGNGTFLN